MLVKRKINEQRKDYELTIHCQTLSGSNNIVNPANRQINLKGKLKPIEIDFRNARISLVVVINNVLDLAIKFFLFQCKTPAKFRIARLLQR